MKTSSAIDADSQVLLKHKTESALFHKWRVGNSALNHCDGNKNAITQHCEQIKRRGEDISESGAHLLPAFCCLALWRCYMERGHTKRHAARTQNWQVAPNACRFASSAKLFSPAGFSALSNVFLKTSPLSNRRLACRPKNRPAVDDKSLEFHSTLLK